MDDRVPDYRGYHIVRLASGLYRAFHHPEIGDYATLSELHAAIDRHISRNNELGGGGNEQPRGPSL